MIKKLFLQDNDIFYKSSPVKASTQLTFSGKINWTTENYSNVIKTLVQKMRKSRVLKDVLIGVPGLIYNGIADWLYEEEILGQSSASWVGIWSQLMILDF